MSLRDFIKRASFAAEKVFKRQGMLAPMFHFVARDGHEAVVAIPPGLDKDDAAQFARGVLAKFDAKCVVWIDEAWALDSKAPGVSEEGFRLIDAGLSVEHIPGRKEVVVLMGEDEHEGIVQAQREIVRPNGAKPYLAALTYPLDAHPKGTPQAEGRLVGLLPRKGHMQ